MEPQYNIRGEMKIDAGQQVHRAAEEFARRHYNATATRFMTSADGFRQGGRNILFTGTQEIRQHKVALRKCR